MPTARQLETFLAIAREGSIRGAAESMGVSQPTVSKQLLALEGKLGLPLFVRQRGSTAKLTDDGRRLLRQAEETFAGQMRLSRRAGTGRLPPVVTVLCRHHLFSEIEPWIEDLRLANGATRLRFEIIDNIADYNERIMADRDTVAIVRSISATSAGASNFDVIAINPCSLFASCEAVGDDGSGRLPQGLPILMPEWGELSNLLKAHLKVNGVADYNFVSSSPFVASVLRQVMDGKGAAVFMDSHVEDYVTAGKLVRLGREVAPLYLQFVSHPAIMPSLRKLVRDKLCHELLYRRSSSGVGAVRANAPLVNWGGQDRAR